MIAKRRLLCAVGSLSWTACALLGACASDESDAPTEPDAAQPETSAPDAAGNPDADAAPCTNDCEYFPPACTPDALCPNGPFDPVDSTVGMDWRTRINVIRGRSATDVWLAGTVGSAAHFDGTSWKVSVVGTQESQRALWLASAGEIALGSIARIYARGLGGGDPDASSGGWSLRATPPLPDDFGTTLTASWAAPGADSLWLATETALWRLHLTPQSKLEVLPGIPSSVCSTIPCNQVLAIHGATAKTLWAVGEHGAAFRIDDADSDAPAITQLDSLTLMGLTGVWALSDSDVWAVGGSGTIRRYTGGPLQWEAITGVPTNENLNAVWGTSASDVWVAGNAGVVLHYDGASWSRIKLAALGGRRPDLFSLWSPGPGHLWAGGYGVVLSIGGNP